MPEAPASSSPPPREDGTSTFAILALGVVGAIGIVLVAIFWDAVIGRDSWARFWVPAIDVLVVAGAIAVCVPRLRRGRTATPIAAVAVGAAAAFTSLTLVFSG